MQPLREHSDFCVVVPIYNHAATLPKVVEDIQMHGYDVLVVNDGSTDATHDVLAQLIQKQHQERVQGLNLCQNQRSTGDSHLLVIEFHKNRGKGYALRKAMSRLNELGYRYAISIDADGQHFASDISLFTQGVAYHPDALLIGARGMKHDNMPKKNTFANRFSNFWFALQTGRSLPDTQSGFRLYPIRKLAKMTFLTTRYEWELEVLVRAAWAGIPLVSKPISVYYPRKEERISHFRPGMDFLRISLLNTFLCLGALLYFYPVCCFRHLFCRRSSQSQITF